MTPLTPRQHETSATIPPSKGYPRGRFPMPDVRHAELAEEFLPRAKGLSGSQESAVKARAVRMIAAKRVLGR